MGRMGIFAQPKSVSMAEAKQLGLELSIDEQTGQGRYSNLVVVTHGGIDVGYPEVRHAAPDKLLRAVRQVGPVQWDGEKIVKGVIIRHLILPGQVENFLKVLDWIGETFAPGEVLVSLMRQYTPMPGLPAPFDRKITQEEYDAVLSWMFLNDLEGFTQEADAADSMFIPDF